jgi:energy-coupling factor transporter ATP-binding protein EcfA2
MSDSTTIHVKNNTIPKICDTDYQLFINMLTIIYGTSGSGKSSILIYLLNILKDKIPIGIVCNPTHKVNKAYNNFPEQCIYEDVSKELLIKIFERQTQALSMYNLVRDIKILTPLFNIISDINARERISKLNNILHLGINEINNKCNKEDIETSTNDLTEKYEHKVVKTMRYEINKHIKLLQNSNLSEMQRSIIRNFNFNPNLLLVIDDCAASIKDWKDLKETKELFFNGRHFKVTTILTMQDDAIIPPPLKKNAHISIFTNEPVANTYIKRDSSGIPASIKKDFLNIASIIFKPNEHNTKKNYKKLVRFGDIVPTDYKTQYMIAIPKKRKFGSSAYWELCNASKKSDCVDSSNNNCFSTMFNISN